MTTSGAFAQGYKKISLDDAIKMGASNNLDIKNAKLDVEIAKNNIKAANRLQNPSINTFFNLGNAGHGNPQEIGLSQTIEILKRDPRKKLAKSNLDLTNQNVEFTKFDRRMDIRESYVDLVASKTILIALEEQHKLLQELLNIAQKRFDAGASPEMEVIQAKIAMNQMVTQINTAKVNVKTARFEFNKALNIKLDSPVLYDAQEEVLPQDVSFIELFTPSPNKTLPAFSEISELALNNRYDIKIAKQQIDVSQKNLTLVLRQLVPDVAVQGGYLYQGSQSSGTGQFLNGAYVGASLVNIPLLYSYRPEIKNAKLQIEQSQLNYNSVHNKATQTLDEAYESFATAQMNLNFYNDNLLKDSSEMIRLSKRSYQVGKANLTTLIVMQQYYRSIVVGYTQALTNYYDCWIDFLREVNNEEFMLHEEKP